MTGHVRRRSVAAYVVLGGVLLATVGPTSGAAHPERDRRALDTTSSAHPSSVRPSVRDDAFAEGATRDREVEADATGTSSATCDGCAAESTTLQVLYVSRARAARLDNAAVAWTQSCRECTATSLSVQVVVLRGRPTVVPNNRALALNAACAACRTASAAFQLVVVADGADRLSEQSLTELRTWFDDQAALLRASVVAPADGPTPPGPTPTAPTTAPTTAPPPEPTSAPTPAPTSESTALPPAETATTRPRGSRRRDTAGDQQVAASALAELTGLVTTDLSAEKVSSDVVLTR